jgi:hypothetical protein
MCHSVVKLIWKTLTLLHEQLKFYVLDYAFHSRCQMLNYGLCKDHNIFSFPEVNNLRNYHLYLLEFVDITDFDTAWKEWTGWIKHLKQVTDHN